LKALHLSDVHLDYSYQPGTKEACGLAACCRSSAGFPPAGEPGAGEWGSLWCDLPMRTFEHMLKFVTDEIKPDMVFWTGDNTAHNVWSNTADETLMYTTTVTTMIKQAFKKTDITMWPIHGNHDTWVEEFQDFSKPGINYEINHFKQYWEDWLDEDAMEEFGKYGFYAMDMKLLNGKSLPSGSRLIALNTQ